jgi:hypothetical protein
MIFTPTTILILGRTISVIFITHRLRLVPPHLPHSHPSLHPTQLPHPRPSQPKAYQPQIRQYLFNSTSGASSLPSFNSIKQLLVDEVFYIRTVFIRESLLLHGIHVLLSNPFILVFIKAIPQKIHIFEASSVSSSFHLLNQFHPCFLGDKNGRPPPCN